MARILVALMLGLGLAACEDEDYLAGVDDAVVEELERLSVTATSDAEIQEILLPDDLDAGANWGVKAAACTEGSYDLYPFAGENVTLTSAKIKGSCQDMSIKIFVVSKEETIACVYLSSPDGVPGIWSINAEACEY